MNRILRSRLATYSAATLVAAIAFLVGLDLLLGPTLPLRYATIDEIVLLALFALVALVVCWSFAALFRSREMAAYRAQREATLSRLGQRALTSHDQTELLNEAAALLCRALRVEYASILQVVPEGRSLWLRAGSGWPEGLDGQVVVEAGLESAFREALDSSAPVVLRRPPSKGAPQIPLFITNHKIKSGIGTSIRGVGQPFGVLCAFSTLGRVFSKEEIDTLKSFSDILSSAIERVHVETQIREQRAWLRLSLSSIGDGVIVTDPQGIVTFVNSVALKLTGCAPDEFLNAQLDSVFHTANERTGQALESPVAQVIRTGQMVKPGTDTVLVSKSGANIPIDDSAAPMRNAEGLLTGTVLIVRDITERRRIEQAIRESEERFRVALKDSPVVVFNQDKDLLYTWVYNPGRGFPQPSVVGKKDVDWMPQGDAARWADLKRGVLASGTGTREEVSAVVEGQRRTFDLTVEPLHDGKGNIVGITCASIDITERKRDQAITTRLAAIVESSEDAIIGKTLDGIILSWNPGAERLYGYHEDEIVGQSVSTLYPPDRMIEFREVTQQLRRGEPVAQHDTRRVRKDGTLIDVSVSESLVRDTMGRVTGSSTIARDITQRKRQEELQRFRAEASDILGSSLDFETALASVAQLAVPRIADVCTVHLLAGDGTIQQLALAHVNPAKLDLYWELARRYPPDPNAPTGVPKVIRTGQLEFVEHMTDNELSAAARDVDHLKLLVELGMRSSMIIPLTVHKRTLGAVSFVSSESGRHFTEDDLALVQDLANRVALSVENARLFQELQKGNAELELRVVRRTIELQAANEKLQKEIAERQRGNEQLRQLSAHLQSAREEERTRVAREIHDELGQVLTAVKMDLALLARNLSIHGRPVAANDVVKEITDTTHLVDETISKMREIIRELRPEILDHLGLRAAIEWQVQEFQTRTGIRCDFTGGDDNIPLDLDRATAVFRILQETLTNVARHANASKVDIQLERQADQLVLDVCDNGKGITESEISSQSSFGLLGMRERALIFGGEIDLKGDPGRGTRVTVRIPLEGAV